jgi:hypothetical protein
MAIKSRYNVVPMGDSINIVQPKSGVDMLLETVSQYADPNYQLNRKELAMRERQINADNRRADATLELNQRKASESSRRQDDLLAIEKQNAQTAREKYLAEKKDKETEKLMFDFNLIAGSIERNEEGFKDLEDNIAKYMSGNPDAFNRATQTINALRAQTTRDNNEADALGAFFNTQLTDGFEYDPELHRDLFIKEPAFKNQLLNKAIDASYGSKIPESMKLAYDADMKILGGLLTSYAQALGDSQKEKALKAVQSAYIPFKERYGQYDAGASTIEGLIGYEEPSDDDINLEGTEKIEDEQGISSNFINTLFGGSALSASPTKTKPVVNRTGTDREERIRRRMALEDMIEKEKLNISQGANIGGELLKMLSGMTPQSKAHGGKILSKKEMYMQRRKNRR